MLSSFLTLLLLTSPATAVVARSATEPTKVTKLHTDTEVIYPPCHTAHADIHARQLIDSLPCPTCSEPSWVLLNGPTPIPTTLSASTSSSSYKSQEEVNIDKFVVIAVLSSVGGSMLIFGLVGCCIKGWAQRSSNGTGKGKHNGASKHKRNGDIEMTAGLVSNAAAPGVKRHHRAAAPSAIHPRRFEESLDEIVLTPKYPKPVYKNDIPPQSCHYPEGEARQ